MKRILRKRLVLDEREIQEMYRIEHVGFWATVMLLFGAIVVQLILDARPVQVAGEAVVLAVVCVAMLIAYARHGIWDANSRPNVRDNARYSVCFALVVGLIVSLTGHAQAAVIATAVMLLAMFVLLEMMSRFVQARQRRREAALDEELEDEIDS